LIDRAQYFYYIPLSGTPIASQAPISFDNTQVTPLTSNISRVAGAAGDYTFNLIKQRTYRISWGVPLATSGVLCLRLDGTTTLDYTRSFGGVVPTEDLQTFVTNTVLVQVGFASDVTVSLINAAALPLVLSGSILSVPLVANLSIECIS
jgi:hypothetical protein